MKAEGLASTPSRLGPSIEPSSGRPASMRAPWECVGFHAEPTRRCLRGACGSIHRSSVDRLRRNWRLGKQCLRRVSQFPPDTVLARQRASDRSKR
jgi:hypothetical protein